MNTITEQKIAKLEQNIIALKQAIATLQNEDQATTKTINEDIAASEVMFFDTIKQAYAVFCPGKQYTLQEFRPVFKHHYTNVSVRTADNRIVKQYRSKKYNTQPKNKSEPFTAEELEALL